MGRDTSPESLYALQQRLVQEIEPIKDLTGWNMAAITAGREGGRRRQIWEDLLNEMQKAYTLAEEAQWYLLKYAPAIPVDCLPDHIEKVLGEMVTYLAEGGKLSGLKLLTKHDWKTVLEKATVKGRAPESIEDFRALYSLVRLNTCRKDLFERWRRQMVPLGGPDIGQLGPEPERTIFQFVDPLQRCLQWSTQTWAPLETALKQQGFRWDAYLAETPIVPGEYGAILHLRTAVVEKLPDIIAAEAQRRKIRSIDQGFAELQRSLERVGGDTNRAEVVQMLHRAVGNRDAAAYQQAYHRLVNLHAKRASVHQRYVFLQKLEKQAPSWANAIQGRTGIHGKSELPGDPDDAWLWRQLTDELERRARISLIELQDRVARLNNELFRATVPQRQSRQGACRVREKRVRSGAISR